ncbi:MAG: hypothetical protein AAGA86_10345 [Bacteroidota bacterium]
MKRIQLFEFEDQVWFPSWLRACLTNLIVVLQQMMGTPTVLAQLLGRMLRKHNVAEIVDLGSGSGGAMPQVLRILRSQQGTENTALTLTDRFPNAKRVQHFGESAADGIRYLGTSLDARDLASAPSGIKTMVNSFHHMPPNVAREILKSAQENHQPILIYEIGENNIPLLVWILFLPLSLTLLVIMSLCMTPFVRPLTWRQLVFTYIIPVIPICYAWDGQASLPRMYTFADMELLLKGLENPGYTWEKGYAKNVKGKKKGTYLMGTPQ